MVCGVYLGILLICLVQMEYVHCFWETQGKSFRKENANTYNPFTQDRLRRTSFSSGFHQILDQGFSGSSYSEVAPKMTQNGRSRVQHMKRLQEPNGGMMQDWPPQWSGIVSASFVSKSASPEKTDFTAVIDSPAQGSQGRRSHMSSSGASQSSREKYAFRKPQRTPAKAQGNPKNTVQTSATVRGNPVLGFKKRTYNQKESFPFSPVQVKPYPSSHQLYSAQSNGGYGWSRPQSNFNEMTPNDKDASSTLTYRISDKYGGSFIVRQKDNDQSEEVRPSVARRPPLQEKQGQKVFKSVWKKVKSKSNMTPLD